MTLHLEPLKKALASLQRILQQPKNEFIRAGTVQCFEYTFELAWKTMQRTLKEQGLSPGSPMQTFRDAEKIGLIADLSFWIDMLKKRNVTVHTYNEDVAEEVYVAATKFPTKVLELLKRLEEENRAP